MQHIPIGFALWLGKGKGKGHQISTINSQCSLSSNHGLLVVYL